jgi:hypothetical protein
MFFTRNISEVMKIRFVRPKKKQITSDELMLRVQIGVYKLYVTKKRAIKLPEVMI